jgi:predicted nucleic-acid-binding Zn-ribbon protein
MGAVPERVQVNGRTLACRWCGGDSFEHRELRLETTNLTPLLSKGAAGAICLTCGYVHIFAGGDLSWRRLDRPDGAD